MARRPYTGPGEPLPLDLARLASIRAFAAAVQESLSGAAIDILVLNAGTQYSNVDTRTEDGFETTFAGSPGRTRPSSPSATTSWTTCGNAARAWRGSPMSTDTSRADRSRR